MNIQKNECGITQEESSCDILPIPEDATVTMAYIPFQLDLSYYCPADALKAGTLFPVLNKPFKGRCTK